MMRTRANQLPLKASWRPHLYASVLCAGLCVSVAADHDSPGIEACVQQLMRDSRCPHRGQVPVGAKLTG